MTDGGYPLARHAQRRGTAPAAAPGAGIAGAVGRSAGRESGVAVRDSVDAVSDVAEFGAFVNGRYPALARSAFLLVGDRGRAEDLVQEALLRTYRAGARVRDHEAFARTVMTRLAIRSWKHRSRAERPGPLPETAAHEAGYDGVEAADVVLRALAALDPSQRAVLVLRYWDQRSEAEIAEILRCSPGTVKSRASRGIAAMRAAGLLGSEEPDVLEGPDE